MMGSLGGLRVAKLTLALAAALAVAACSSNKAATPVWRAARVGSGFAAGKRPGLRRECRRPRFLR
jgi:hypothetical protein